MHESEIMSKFSNDAAGNHHHNNLVSLKQNVEFILNIGIKKYKKIMLMYLNIV